MLTTAHGSVKVNAPHCRNKLQGKTKVDSLRSHHEAGPVPYLDKKLPKLTNARRQSVGSTMPNIEPLTTMRILA